jgi:glucan-binding YG repeat protein
MLIIGQWGIGVKKIVYALAFVFVVFMGFSTKTDAAVAGDKDCKDFSSKQEVMEFWYSNGYSASYDPHRLDGDNDGLPCEVSAGEYNQFVASKGTGSQYTGWQSSNGKWYYYANGSLHKGWLFNGGKWYYLDQNGVMKTGWLSLGGIWYYLDSNGAMTTGWLNGGGNWYYFNESGAMETGWVYFEEGPDGYSWYFFKNSGEMVTGWYYENGYWYYLYESGYLATGWIHFNNSDAVYYANAAGQMQTGWVKLGYLWVYLKSNGLYEQGWINDNGTWYYQTNQGLKKGWFFENGHWYYFDQSGAMKTGWVTDGGSWYYLGSNGNMKTGWLLLGNTWYFLDRQSGEMLDGWNHIDGKTYYFYTSGAMAANTIIEGKEIGPDGAVIANESDLETVTRIAMQYGVTVEVDPNTDAFDLFDGDEYIGFAMREGIVIGDPAYLEMFKELALALGVPATKEELNQMISQAQLADEEVNNGTIAVYIDESVFQLLWGFEI